MMMMSERDTQNYYHRNILCRRRRKGDRASYTKGRDRSPVRSKGPGQRDHSERGSGAGLRPGPPYKRQGGPSSISRKMDPKELERRRQEMMSLAKYNNNDNYYYYCLCRSRDKERESKLRKHEVIVIICVSIIMSFWYVGRRKERGRTL